MADITVITPRTRHSPCVGICKLDEATGYCLGCARTGDEIGRWSGMSEAQRDAVWAELPERHVALDLDLRLMPWMTAEVMSWVADSITQRLGTWVVGAPGAVAEFPCTPGRDVAVVGDEALLVARAADAAFRLEAHDKLRAFEYGSGGPIVLGLPKVRGSLPIATTFTALGADEAAVDARHRGDALFDMGIGRKASRFCIRAGEGKLRDTLTGMSGRPWSEVMYDAGMAIFAEHPHRVVESKLARVEVYSPIPLPGAASPAGAHTHFLPEHFKAGREAPADLTLPDYAFPIATFYPAKLAHQS